MTVPPVAKSFPLVLFVSLSFFACGNAPARPQPPIGGGLEVRDASPEPLDHWTKLGERVLGADGKHDMIRASADEGRFSSIRFVLEYGTLEITSVVVTFDDGSKVTSTTPLGFGKGTRSRAIDLPGDKRAIRQIDFDYATRAIAGRSTQVELWAQ